MSEQSAEHASDHHAVTALPAVSEEVLCQARKATAGRTAETIAADSSLRATLIALVSASELSIPVTCCPSPPNDTDYR